MKLKLWEVVVVAIIAIATVVALLLLNHSESPEYYFKQQQRMVERVLAANPNELLLAGREMLERRPNYVGEINPAAHEIPVAIRKLKPTRIFFQTNSVSVDFSDAFNPFGIVVVRTGMEGGSMVKWIDGLWLFHDGQLHNRLKPDGSLK